MAARPARRYDKLKTAISKYIEKNLTWQQSTAATLEVAPMLVRLLQQTKTQTKPSQKTMSNFTVRRSADATA